MSAVELDDRSNPNTALYYAPRRPRQRPVDFTIRPVLERLQRGERSDVPYIEPEREAPSIAPAFLPIDTAATSFVSIALRLAAVLGVCGGVAALTVWYQAPERADRAAPAPSVLPKPVQTISYKSQARMSGAALPRPEAETEGQPLRDGADAVAPLRNGGDAALPAALSLYAAVPPTLSSGDWKPQAQNAFDEAMPNASAAPPQRAYEHAAGPHHRRHVSRRHGTHAAEQTQRAEQPARTATAAPDTSLRAVLHKIFGPQP